jgi:DHA2 family multidrug resistance protein-like MFS transporter
MASSIANFVANSGLVLLLPFYLVEGSGLSVDRAGMALVPLSLLMALIAPVSGRLGDRIGPRLPSTAGMLLLCVGTGLLALLPEFVPVLGVVLLMIVAGAGIGLFTSTNTTAIMAAVPQDRLGVAGGIVHTARYIGLTGGVALAGAVYTLVAQSESGAGSLTAYRVAFGVLAAIAAMGAILSGLTAGRGARQPSAPASEARR